ncbi:MAG: FHA domain-containing protein [Actinomycetota bacterium]
MPTIVLDLLKYVFLAILYIFMARAVRAIYMELRPSKAQPPARRSSQPKPQQKRSKKSPKVLKVLEGEGLKGKTFTLDGELLVGRGEKCQIVLSDTYASQVHARFFRQGEQVMVEDMGSTNGTYLNRQKVTSPTEVYKGDRVKIGKTVLELRR